MPRKSRLQFICDELLNIWDVKDFNVSVEVKA